jgi:hypothetical protein
MALKHEAKPKFDAKHDRDMRRARLLRRSKTACGPPSRLVTGLGSKARREVAA